MWRKSFYAISINEQDFLSFLYQIYAEINRRERFIDTSLYYRVVVIRVPLQGLYATLKGMLWIGVCLLPQARWFQKGSNHSPLRFC